MSRLAAVFVHVGPIIGDQSIERAPQRQITAVQHPGILLDPLAGLIDPSYLWSSGLEHTLVPPHQRYRSSQRFSKRWRWYAADHQGQPLQFGRAADRAAQPLDGTCVARRAPASRMSLLIGDDTARHRGFRVTDATWSTRSSIKGTSRPGLL